jgi:hypothetical protein
MSGAKRALVGAYPATGAEAARQIAKQANNPTTDNQTWRREGMEFLLRKANGLKNGGNRRGRFGPKIIVSVHPPGCQPFCHQIS